jgi:hypothetical protein
MDTNVKNNILKYEYEVQSTKEKISCNKYEPKVTLEDKVYPKSITNINQGMLQWMKLHQKSKHMDYK